MAFPIENLLSPNMTNLLITLVIPFLIIFAVLLFSLKKTRVLGGSNSIYVLIALGLTIMIYALKPETFQFLASYLFQIGVAGAIIALVGVVIMIFFPLLRKGESIAKSLKSDEQKLKDLEKEEEKLLKQFHSGGLFGSPDMSKRVEISKKLKTIEEERKYLYLKNKRLVS